MCHLRALTGISQKRQGNNSILFMSAATLEPGLDHSSLKFKETPGTHQMGSLVPPPAINRLPTGIRSITGMDLGE